MSASRAGSLAVHVAAAKRLLQELEQHAVSAMDAIGQETGAPFLEAIDERDRILTELSEVVESLAHARAEVPSDKTNEQDAEANAMLAEMAEAAAAALESHELLLERTQRERDRLAAALKLTHRPDSVANQYAAATAAPRAGSISVTG
ncbi:MAG TPA: hypothetical protein VN706_25730 [Gemmatimonadaceae bacterium]|nr:hypothetical protein [Gemmatimonadaceae bacterium]